MVSSGAPWGSKTASPTVMRTAMRSEWSRYPSALQASRVGSMASTDAKRRQPLFGGFSAKCALTLRLPLSLPCVASDCEPINSI